MKLIIESDPARTYRILFLEDNKDDIELMERELKSAGINFISMQTMHKKEFIDAVYTFNPEIILADYSLPSFNGIQAFRYLKQHNINLPFILVTGSLSEELALVCLNEGFDDFILKSSFKRLPSAIIKSFEKKQIQNEKEKISLSLKTTQDELRLLLGSVQCAREEDRIRISREIHDELGQSLTAMKIDVSILKKKISNNLHIDKIYIEDELGSIIHLIDKTIESVKRIATELRPEVLDHLGVTEAIKWQLKEFEHKTGITCQLNNLQKSWNVEAPVDTTIYRIIQEALTNIARHSKATTVNLRIERDQKNIQFEIKDNGIGINKVDLHKSKTLGLLGMRERVLLLNGTLNIDGSPNQGTIVSVKIPLP